MNRYVIDWIERNRQSHQIELVRKASELGGGDLLFLISCSELLTKSARAAYQTSLVIHASDLPRGRGWSPHIWEILNGAETITLSLLEAADDFDAGNIWKKTQVYVPNTALYAEINHLIFIAELELMDFAISSYKSIEPKAQSTCEEATYYPKRTPANSRIDVYKTIAEQFDLIRVCDPYRFPVFFEFRGVKYRLNIEEYRDE